MTLVAITDLTLPVNATPDQILAHQIECSLPLAYDAFMKTSEVFQSKAHLGDFALLNYTGGEGVIIPHHPDSAVGKEVAKFKSTFLDALSFACSFHIGEPVEVQIGACCSLVIYAGQKPNLSWLQYEIDRLNQQLWESRYDCG